MKNHRYVVITAVSGGTTRKQAAKRGSLVYNRCYDPATLEDVELNELLDAGWVPVRETAMGTGDSSCAYALVLLAKEGDEGG